MKAIWKSIFVLLLAVGGIFTLSLNTQAAAKPYEYTFEKDSTASFNNISSINKLVLTFFEKKIEVEEDEIFDEDAVDSNPIYVVQKGSTERINIIKHVDVSDSKETLTVQFKNLDFIDYSDPAKVEYELVIDKETLLFDQLEEYRIPFKIYDILPGFKSTFIDTAAETINKHIFKINAPRDVYIHVPKIYIRGIETIHHYKGIMPAPLPNEDKDIEKEPVNPGYNQNNNPALTNIDILADEEATRLKVEFGTDTNTEYSRDLARHGEVQGFTMGQAGINEITENNVESATEFSLRAYNDHGRFLEERKFKLRVDDPKKDFKIDDYLPEPTKEFGTTYSLYDLMSDPALLNRIIERIPVSQLDSLGITYAVGNSEVGVNNAEELSMALDNPKVTKITLLEDINLGSEQLIVNRSVTIDGQNHKFTWDTTAPTGNKNIKLEKIIDDITVRFNNLTIDDGNLIVDVGLTGTAILDNVTLNGTNKTEIMSGGTNSIHLNNFKTDELIIKNSAALRVVVNGELKKSNETDTLVTIRGAGEVTLEGKYPTVNVESNTTLIMKETTEISSIDVADGQTLTIKGSGKGITSVTGQIEFPSGDGIVETKTVPLNAISNIALADWGTIGHGNIFNLVETNKNILESISWELNNEYPFGPELQVIWDGSTIKIQVLDPDAYILSPPITGNIVLEGIYYELNGEVKLRRDYTIILPVEIKN